MKILVLCTGNSCRSQMAAGFLRTWKPRWVVRSAGTDPEKAVSPFAVAVMKEKDIDISREIPRDVREFVDEDFDRVITVCDHAREVCPVFSGRVGARLHRGFADPAAARGSQDEILEVYRRTRDEIAAVFSRLVRQWE